MEKVNIRRIIMWLFLFALSLRLLWFCVFIFIDPPSVSIRLIGGLDGGYASTVELIKSHGVIGAFRQNAIEVPIYPLYLWCLERAFGTYLIPNVIMQSILRNQK